MEKLLEKSNKSIHSLHFPHQRGVIGKINWEWRMNGIIGARGTGKTTLLLQKSAQFQKDGHEVLYVRLDDLYFADHGIYNLADSFRKNGGKNLYLDEVHKYSGLSNELKNIYDSIPELKVVFSGSSIIELTKKDADLRLIGNFDIAQSKKMLTLSKVIAASVPFKPNISKTSEKTGLHRQTVLQYFQYLEKARMIKLVNQLDRFISCLQKPGKIFLDNPNLFFALNPEMLNPGNLRETFALNQLAAKHEVFLHEPADFLVDNKLVIEIGDKNNDIRRGRDVENAYVFMDVIEIGHHNRIPLWLLGFLY